MSISCDFPLYEIELAQFNIGDIVLFRNIKDITRISFESGLTCPPAWNVLAGITNRSKNTVDVSVDIYGRPVIEISPEYNQDDYIMALEYINGNIIIEETNK